MTPSDPGAVAGRIRNARVLTAVLAAGNFAIGMGAFVVIGVLSPMAADLGMSKTGAGMVMTVYAISYAVLSPVLVSLVGGVNRRAVLVAALGIFFAASLLAAFAPDAGVLYAARVFAAVGGGLFTPIAASVVFSASPPERRGKALAGVFLGMTLAQALGIPIGSFIGYTLGWQAVFLSVAALTAVTLVLAWRLVPRGMAFAPNSLWTLVEALRDWRSLFSVLVTANLTASAYFVYTFITPLLEERMGFGRDGVALVLLVYGVGAVIGSWMAGLLTDRFGPMRTLIGVALVQAAVMPAFSFLPMPVWLLLLVTFVWSLSGWSYMIPQQARIVRHRPQRQAVILSLNAACIYVGAAIGSAASGALAERTGLEWLGIAGGVAVLVALAHLLLSEWLVRRGGG